MKEGDVAMSVMRAVEETEVEERRRQASKERTRFIKQVDRRVDDLLQEDQKLQFSDPLEEADYLDYSFHASYLLHNGLKLHAVMSFVTAAALVPSELVGSEVYYLVLAPAVAVIIFMTAARRWLHLHVELHRAQQLGSISAFWIGLSSTVASGAVGIMLTTKRLQDLQEVMPIFLVVAYYINWFMFAIWLQVNTIPLRRRIVVIVVAVVVSIVTPSWSLLSEAEELLLTCSSFSCSFFIGRALERQQRIAHERARQMRVATESESQGDSRLNHVLKNKNAQAAFLIESVLENLRGLEEKAGGGPEAIGTRSLGAGGFSWLKARQQLERVQSILHQNSDWCHVRELFVQVTFH